jgi:hypothetical protein
MNMGEGHMMVVNAHLRAGAKCKAGDVVTVVMELDKDRPTVELPGYLKKIIASDLKAREFWPKAPLHPAEGICAGDGGRQNNRDTRKTHRRHALAPQKATQEVIADHAEIDLSDDTDVSFGLAGWLRIA